MPRKVLLCRSSSALHGPERHILQLAHGMPGHGFAPELLVLYRISPTSPDVHPMIRQAQESGIATMQLRDRSKLPPAVVDGIARRLRVGDISIVHSHGYKTNLLVGIVAAMMDVPRVATMHLHTRATHALKAYRLLDLVVLRRFPVIIAVSRAVRRELLAAGLSPDKVVTIHNGVDVDAIQASVTARREVLLTRWRLDPRYPVVTTIGRLTWQKGQDTFLEAAHLVLGDFPTAQFVILGDGPDRGSLEQLAAQLGIQSHVYFAGYQTEVTNWMAASDVIALASRGEGIPYVLLEALALGRPVVTTDVGGIPEVLSDGRNGLMVPCDAPALLAQQIIHLLQRPTRAEALARLGQLRVRQGFSVAEMVRRTVEVYDRVLSH